MFVGVDTDRDRYRSAARELKRDCAIPESFSRFDRSRLERDYPRSKSRSFS